MTYTDTATLARHTGHKKDTVIKALKLTKTPFDRLPGKLGIRVKESDANKMIAKVWPTCRPLRVADYQHPLTRSTEK